MWPTGQGRWFSPATPLLWDPTCSTAFSYGAPSPRPVTCWSASRGGHEDAQRLAGALSNPVWWEVSLPMAGVGTRWALRPQTQPILLFYDKQAHLFPWNLFLCKSPKLFFLSLKKIINWLIYTWPTRKKEVVEQLQEFAPGVRKNWMSKLSRNSARQGSLLADHTNQGTCMQEKPTLCKTVETDIWVQNQWCEAADSEKCTKNEEATVTQIRITRIWGIFGGKFSVWKEKKQLTKIPRDKYCSTKSSHNSLLAFINSLRSCLQL